jgi:excisionase family DNA binding protein
MQAPDHRFLLVEEVAALLRCCPRTIRRMVETEDLCGFRIGAGKKKLLITKASVLAYVKSAIQTEAGALDED